MRAINPSAESRVHTVLPDPVPDRILDDLAVSLITTLPRSTILRLSRDGGFPRAVVLCTGRIGWRQSDVVAWISSRLAEGDAA